MPTASEDLGSPRDVIRNWLSRTNGCDKPSVGGKRHGHDMDDNMHGKYQQLADHHSGTRKVQEESVSGLRQRRRTEAKALQTNAEYKGRARPVDKPAQTLPSRLGLQAPFRLLGEEAHPQDLQRHDRHHTKKRRISVSSDTTYLQPATAAANAESENGKRSHSRRHHPRVDPYDVDDDDLTPSILSSSSYSVTDCSPKKPAKTYDRKPRHKTRDDRYEKKQIKELAKAKAKKAAKKGDKRKRKTRSGAAPTHNFTAKNVTQDRLTLRPVQKIGLFKKGRASSPVRRRGLPDLSFSEMTFLSTRRDRDRETEEITHRNKRQRKDKAADAEDEISRFFTSARVPTADSDGEIGRTRLRGQGAITDTRRRRSKNKRRASSVNSSALPESIAAADLPGRPFLGFGNRGARPLSSRHVHGNTSDTSTAKSPVRVSRESTIRARSPFTWSISGAASHGSGTDGLLNCMETDPQGKVDGGASGETVSDAGQLNSSGPTFRRCHCQLDGGSTEGSSKGDKLRVDAAMPNAASVESPKPAEQDRSHQWNIQEAKPEGQKNERQPVANASGNQQAATRGATDVSDSDRAVLKTPPLLVEESIATQEEGSEIFDLGIDRLLHECRTKAAEAAHGQEERHNQAATQEQQDVPSPLRNRQFDSHTVKVVDIQEQTENGDRYRYPQQIDFNNAAAPDRENGAGMTHDCTVGPEPGSNAHRNECDDLYRRNVSMDAIEGYVTVPQGHENINRNASQEARRLHGSHTPDRGRLVSERSDALMRDSNIGITSGSWPLAYDYNLVGPSIEHMSHQNLNAAQDSKWHCFPQPYYDGRNQGQPINYHENDVEKAVEGWNPPSDDVTIVQDLGVLGERGFSDSYDQIDGVDVLPITSTAINASNLEQVDTRGHARHRLIGLESSAALSPTSFSRLGSSGSIFSRGTADQRYTNSPPMPGFWQPHKLY